MKKEEGFEFIPKKWLGDAHVISMDWDVKGMHITLIALSWQKEPQGYILNDDSFLRKLVGNPDIDDWNNRIKPQLLTAWEVTTLKDNAGIEKIHLVQPGVLDTVLKKQKREENSLSISSTPKVTKTRKKKVVLVETENPPFDGFSLSDIAKLNTKTTILFAPASEEDTVNIWSIGKQFLEKHGIEKKSSSGLLARWIKKYGSQEVAGVMVELSIKNSQPADVVSFVTSILEKRIGVKKPKMVTVAL